MSVKEVTILRKSGKLTEAYKMAVSDLKEDPRDSWAQMSLFWVLRDMCEKFYLTQNNTEIIHKCLNQMKILLSTMVDNNGAGKNAYNNLYKKLQSGADDISKASELSKSDPIEAYSQIESYIASPMSIDKSLHEDLGWILFRYIKAQITSLQSVEVRRLLRDYMNLQNERPSMLHSNILNIAINFSKESADFSFYKFFLLWGPANLRHEDLHKGYYNGHNVPSLISRIIKIIIDRESDIDVEKLCDNVSLSRSTVLDLIREPLFWKMQNCGKEGDLKKLYILFDEYSGKYAKYGPSHWNSEVLKLVYRYTDKEEMWRFVNFFRSWNYENLNEADWKEDKDDKGNVYKSLAIKSAKRCYEYIKSEKAIDSDIIEWLSGYYDKLTVNGLADEWSLRERATLYFKQGKYDVAISSYKDLILEMSEKYYLWSELAACIIDDNSLKIALLSKAILLERNESFLGDIRLSLAELFVAEGMISEAMFELNTYKQTREKEGWRLSSKHSELMHLVGDNSQKENHKAKYYNYVLLADEFVFSEIESIEVTLVSRWKDDDGKTRCSFTDGDMISFQVNANRFASLHKANLGQAFKVKCHEKSVDKEIESNNYLASADATKLIKYVPLIMSPIQDDLWTSLPLKYGYIEYVNKEKKVLHIITQDSKQGYYSCKDTDLHNIVKGDFVSCREYSVKRKDNMEVSFANLSKVDKEVALPYFSTRIIVVDSVNEQKELIHYVVHPRLLDGIIYFNETSIRPNIGDCLKLTYCVKVDKKGKKRRVNLRVEESNETNNNALKRIKGELVLKYKDSYWDEDDDEYGIEADFAFIGDYYVHRSILRQFNIVSNCSVEADIVCTKEGKWKVIKIYKI
ncbi:MAG: hypothetical protein SNG49_05770 [Rikenellaceae bacterium]